MMEMVTVIIENLVRLVIAGGGSLIIFKGIPWLKKIGMYYIVKMCVMAAEKLAESCQIDKNTKKEYVKKALEQFGIEVTPLIDTMIEAAVKELDIQADKITDAFEEAK